MMSPVMKQFADVLPGLAARYQHLRYVSKVLNQDIMATIDKKTLRSAADMLGMLVKDTVVMDSELDPELAADFALHGVFRDGENTVQRYRRMHRESDPERQMLLDAMAEAIFTLTRVVDTYAPESALVMEDLLMDNQRILVADKSLSSRAPRGLVLCSRLITLDGFWMSTGLGLSMLADGGNPALHKFIDDSDARVLRRSPAEREVLHGAFAAGIVKAFRPSAEEVENARSHSAQEPEAEPVELLQSERVERNAPCPCGSGKKYKKCCGR